MQQYKNPIVLVLAITLLMLSLANIVTHYAAGNSLHTYLFNSDALYLPTLSSDVLGKHGALKDWLMTPAPYFFPDYPLYLLAYLSGSGVYRQIAAFAVIQSLATFLAVWFLARQVTKSNALFAAVTIAICCIWLALTADPPFVFLVVSAHHFGIFLSAIVFFGLWLQVDASPGGPRRNVLLSVIGVLAFVSALSDSLFIVQVIAPLAGMTLLGLISTRTLSWKNLLPVSLVVLLSVAGAVFYRLAVPSRIDVSFSLSVKQLFENLQQIYSMFVTAITNSPTVGILLVIYAGLVLYSFVRFLRGAANDGNLSRLTVFSFLSLCATVATFALVTSPAITPRYFIPVFFWPVIVVLFYLSLLLHKRFVVAAIAISVLAVGSHGWTSYMLAQKNGFSGAHYNETLACVDKVLETNGVTNGIAEYWDAKPIQNFSRLDLNIAQHADDLSEFRWITSRKYFTPSYDFAIITEGAPPRKLSTEALLLSNGPPKSIAQCGDKSIHVYGKDKLVLRTFAKPGDSTTWQACKLRTEIGRTTAECAMEKKDKADAGYVTFGPYVQLPSGRYTFEIAYASSAGKSETIGKWDVAPGYPGKARILKAGTLVGTEGAAGKITGEFVLPPERDMDMIEIRTRVQKNIDLKVIHLRLQRAQ